MWKRMLENISVDIDCLLNVPSAATPAECCIRLGVGVNDVHELSG